MAVRRQRATTSKDILERDVETAIKKGKNRYRAVREFYILRYDYQGSIYYFAEMSPDRNKETGEEVYYQKWAFDLNVNRWKLEHEKGQTV